MDDSRSTEDRTDPPGSDGERSDPLAGEDQFATALADAVPDRAVSELRDTGPSWNDRNRTVEVEFADGDRVFLKVAADGDGSRIARERAVIDYVGANCGVGVPVVVASRTDGPVPYLVTEPFEGEPLLARWSDATVDRRTALARQVGRALAALHERGFDAHGHVEGGGADGLEIRTGSWTEVLVERIEAMRSLASSDRFDHHYDEVIAAVRANRDLLEEAPAALVHGDPARPNAFYGEDGVGFVDWEIAHAGDPARELHRARYQAIEVGDPEDADRLVAAFHAGYRDRAGSLPAGLDDRTPVYEAVWQLSKSGFFDKHLEFSDASEDELARRVETEMERRLEAIRE